MLKAVLPKKRDIAVQLARNPVKIEILYGPFGIIFLCFDGVYPFDTNIKISAITFI